MLNNLFKNTASGNELIYYSNLNNTEAKAVYQPFYISHMGRKIQHLNYDNGNNSTNNSTKNVDIQYSAHDAFLE